MKLTLTLFLLLSISISYTQEFLEETIQKEEVSTKTFSEFELFIIKQKKTFLNCDTNNLENHYSNQIIKSSKLRLVNFIKNTHDLIKDKNLKIDFSSSVNTNSFSSLIRNKEYAQFLNIVYYYSFTPKGRYKITGIKAYLNYRKEIIGFPDPFNKLLNKEREFENKKFKNINVDSFLNLIILAESLVVNQNILDIDFEILLGKTRLVEIFNNVPENEWYNPKYKNERMELEDENLKLFNYLLNGNILQAQEQYKILLESKSEYGIIQSLLILLNDYKKKVSDLNDIEELKMNINDLKKY